MTSPGQATTKAFLQPSSGPALTFTFNPADLTLTKTATWTTKPARNAKAAPTSEFTGTSPQSLKLQITLDSRVEPSPSITDRVKQLFDWTRPDPSAADKKKPQPALLVLHWGTQEYFQCFLASVSAKYTLFDPTGVPLKAVVDLTLTETPLSVAAQNPTSGGLVGRRSRTVTAGESLHSIAYDEYGRAGHWRALATVNGVDDPLRLRPGTVLFVPTQAEADALS